MQVYPSSALDSPNRYDQIRDLIHKKTFLNRIYKNVYDKYNACLQRCCPDGLAIELGSGGGFAKDLVPGINTSDIIAYPNLDFIFDATQMPFEDNSLRAIFLYNVFHHISDVEKFLSECNRCLKVGGRILLIEPHPGIIGYPIYRWLHHEPFDTRVEKWTFESKGPLSDANGALPWIVFRRDRSQFEKLFPQLRLSRYSPNSAFLYWISGGLKSWSLVPGWSFSILAFLDTCLTRIAPFFGSFADIEIVKESH